MSSLATAGVLASATRGMSSSRMPASSPPTGGVRSSRGPSVVMIPSAVAASPQKHGTGPNPSVPARRTDAHISLAARWQWRGDYEALYCDRAAHELNVTVMVAVTQPPSAPVVRLGTGD